MSFFKPDSVTPEPVAAPAQPVYSVEEVFAGAAASAAYAKSVFHDAMAELTNANEDLDEVITRTTDEIDRLEAIRDEAATQQLANEATISRLQALIG